MPGLLRQTSSLDCGMKCAHRPSARRWRLSPQPAAMSARSSRRHGESCSCSPPRYRPRLAKRLPIRIRRRSSIKPGLRWSQARGTCWPGRRPTHWCRRMPSTKSSTMCRTTSPPWPRMHGLFLCRPFIRARLRLRCRYHRYPMRSLHHRCGLCRRLHPRRRSRLSRRVHPKRRLQLLRFRSRRLPSRPLIRSVTRFPVSANRRPRSSCRRRSRATQYPFRTISACVPSLRCSLASGRLSQEPRLGGSRVGIRPANRRVWRLRLHARRLRRLQPGSRLHPQRRPKHRPRQGKPRVPRTCPSWLKLCARCGSARRSTVGTDDGRTLATGQGIEISAEQSILVRAGDAGAVLVSVNNGEKRLLGRDGEVMTRRFVAESADAPVRAPAPRVAPAPQPAPAPLAPAAPARVQPPVASAAPAPAPPVTPPPSAPSSAGSVARANPPSPPAPTASAPSAAPGPAVSQQTSSASQVSIPSGVGNQLSAPAAPLAAPAAVPTPPSPATVVAAVARQWLDAYHRQDRAAMAALSTENLLLADERRADERFPSGLGDVARTLDRVSVQVAADTAVLTAVMMEQSASVPSSPHVSPISQVWVLDGGQWKVRQARFVSEARLNQVFK